MVFSKEAQQNAGDRNLVQIPGGRKPNKFNAAWQYLTINVVKMTAKVSQIFPYITFLLHS